MTTLKSPTTDMNFRTIFLFLCVMIVSTSCRQSSSNHSSSDTIVNVDNLSNGYVSTKTDTKSIMEAIDEDANPLILYYRYRD